VVELVDARDSKEYGREDNPLPKVPMIGQFPKMGIGQKSQKLVFSLEMFSHDTQKQAPNPPKKGSEIGWREKCPRNQTAYCHLMSRT
jgi:hypothetical protein